LSEGRMSEVGRSEELNTREVESWSYTNAITPDLGGRNSTTDVKTVKEGRGGQKKRCSTLEMWHSSREPLCRLVESER
jgi:hypothetical protein